MPVLTNVFRRGGVFYFRARVPVELRSRVGRNELWRSLKTSDPAVARRRGGSVHALTEALWSGLKRAMNESEAQALVDAWLKAKLDEDRDIRHQHPPDFVILHEWAQEDIFGDAKGRQINNDQTVAVRHVDELIAAKGLTVTEAERDMARRMMVRAHAELFGALQARSQTGWRPWLDDDPAAALVAKIEGSMAPTPGSVCPGSELPRQRCQELTGWLGATSARSAPDKGSGAPATTSVAGTEVLEIGGDRHPGPFIAPAF